MCRSSQSADAIIPIAQCPPARPNGSKVLAEHPYYAASYAPAIVHDATPPYVAFYDGLCVELTPSLAVFELPEQE